MKNKNPVFFLTKKAKEDLKNIARYTESKWGREQRNFYLKQLDESFHNLSNNQKLGLDSTFVRDGYRKYRVGRHFVFYKLLNTGEGIEVVRILHERMNIEMHF